MSSTVSRAAQRALVAHIADVGALGAGVDVERAADVAAMLLGHDVCRALALDARWPAAACRSWLFTTLVHQLLGENEPDARATQGLTFTAGSAGQ